MRESTARRQTRCTWSDYRTWDDDERWEIIGGEAFLMSPSPTVRHQRIAVALARQLANHFAGKPCELLIAPMDVVLSEEDVVQPDLLVVCNPAQVQRTHIAGPPALVVEIVSLHSAIHDRMRKLALYARSGVKEDWIVTPWPSLVEVMVLEGGKYVVESVHGKDGTLASPSFPDLRVVLAEVFNFPLEPGEEPPVVKEPPGHAYRA